ncbi:MAG: hypothetical protein QM324_08315 [Bacteroidota bacterium]|nr:hypothetical protein [Bacteroidota bacterium]
MTDSSEVNRIRLFDNTGALSCPVNVCALVNNNYFQLFFFCYFLGLLPYVEQRRMGKNEDGLFAHCINPVSPPADLVSGNSAGQAMLHFEDKHIAAFKQNCLNVQCACPHICRYIPKIRIGHRHSGCFTASKVQRD